MFRQSTFDLDRVVKLLAAAARRRFEDITLCGQGGHAYTFRARDSRSQDRPVAIKVAKHDVDGNKRGVETNIISEGFKAALLSPHENIVQVYELVEFDQGKHALVMEFIEGGSLRPAILSMRGDIARSVDIALGVCRALARAHESPTRVVHRDVKPENILMDLEGTPKLVDFGIALEVATVAEAIGSLNYMAPEYLTGDGHGADPRSDLYSLAVVLFEMLEGTTPYQATNTTEVMNRIKNDAPPELRPDCPTALRRMVYKGLQKSPSARYQSAREMLFDLEQFKAFFRDLWPAMDKFEEGLHLEDREQKAKQFVFLGEIYLDMASEILQEFVGHLPSGPHRTRLQSVAELLSTVDDRQFTTDKAAQRGPADIGIAGQKPLQPEAAGGAPVIVRPASTALEKGVTQIEKLLREGALAEARDQGEGLLTEPEGARTYHGVASAFYRFGICDHALVICDAGLEKHAEHGELHALRGKVLFQSGDVPQAAQALARAAKIGTTDTDAMEILRDIGHFSSTPGTSA